MQVKKVYLVRVAQMVPKVLDLDTVWVLDAKSRSISKVPVQRITDITEMSNLVLRIRCATVTAQLILMQVNDANCKGIIVITYRCSGPTGLEPTGCVLTVHLNADMH